MEFAGATNKMAEEILLVDEINRKMISNVSKDTFHENIVTFPLVLAALFSSAPLLLALAVVSALLFFRDTSPVEKTLVELEDGRGFAHHFGLAEAGEGEGAGDDLERGGHQRKDVTSRGVS